MMPLRGTFATSMKSSIDFIAWDGRRYFSLAAGAPTMETVAMNPSLILSTPTISTSPISTASFACFSPSFISPPPPPPRNAPPRTAASAIFSSTLKSFHLSSLERMKGNGPRSDNWIDNRNSNFLFKNWSNSYCRHPGTT
ncbi:139aa long hypothetical protein [Pyrococcus horikoshii OT3]|uniref:Uncharacterized protein n=1 Tax=Pyrococcus horikoshii (strain ATCC 700860 / DSM 12428 / JCM 9974 / NBRC 100139 / OT-3) TaxID=70601 RepID=O58780_PYRHO|nr:139aa long hypothetical protein [Pyrococcus horikoshii OT3]